MRQPATTKTDNHNPSIKLDLRRYFLRKYHADERPAVLDCCQGSAKLWTELRQEFDVKYWGMDLKPKPGRLKLDSARYLAQAGWPETVIDIDTYGSPWKHWIAMLPNVIRPLTIFLTIGLLPNLAAPTTEEVRAMGLNFRKLKVPASISGRLCKAIGTEYCLGSAGRFGVRILEALEAENDGNARYIGLRVENSRQNSSPSLKD